LKIGKTNPLLREVQKAGQRGAGKLDLNVNYGTNDDKKLTNNRSYYEFIDLKYGWAVAKNFTIMPRILKLAKR
jgi:hypothetical protein